MSIAKLLSIHEVLDVANLPIPQVTKLPIVCRKDIVTSEGNVTVMVTSMKPMNA